MPIEQLSQPLTFYAFFTASKVGLTGLTVTVDVYRVNTSASPTQVVTAGSATAVGGGLYLYQLAGGSVTVEGEYLCIFKTADTTADMQNIPAIWVVQKAGVEYLDAAITSRPSATDYTTARAAKLDNLDAAVTTRSTLTAANVWDYATASATTAGSLGKRISDNLDVVVSTRSTLTAANVWDYLTASATTTGSLGKRIADNLDVVVSTRTDAATWTATKAGYLDTTISSRSTLTAANVWDAATSGLTTAGSIGLRLATNIDAAISSRSTLTAANVWDYTIPTTPVASSYGERLKTNLDATVSSRTDTTTWTATKAGYLDVAISSRSTLTAANVWDYLTSSATTAGSIGKRIADNLDATVSSRGTGTSTLTAANVWDYLTASATTAGSLGKRIADNLDTTVSSRGTGTSTLTAANVWDYVIPTTPVSTSYGELIKTNINTTISSRSTLTAQQVWDLSSASASSSVGTIGRYLVNNLDVAVSTRSTLTAANVWQYSVTSFPAGSAFGNLLITNLDTTVSSRTDTATWTATKAGYLDVAISTRLATAGYTAPPTTANIWDYLTASATTAGSIGKRIADNLDAQVSTRLATSGYTAPDNTSIGTILTRTDVATSTRASATDYTSARAAKIDNLDAAISTRSTLTAANVWDYATASATTAGSLGKRIADNVDATISSRTDSATWTSTKAGYLDVAISSRLATTGYTAPDNTTIANIYARTDVATSTRSTLTAANVWDYAVPVTPVASSYGDRVKTNLDATVSSRTDSTTWNATKAGYLDVAISSRSTLTAANVWDYAVPASPVASSYGDRVKTNLDTTVSSRTDSTVWTNTKAGYVDAAISTRLESASYTAPDNATISSIYARTDVATSTRATIAGIWDYLTASATTAGSLGKLMVDNLNASVSSRLASTSYVAPDNATISSIYARTDVATSTRADATYYTSTRAANLDYLDAAVSSRTDSATWTPTKAGYLDASVSSRATNAGIWDYVIPGSPVASSYGERIKTNLDAAISTRAAAADWTSARAAKVDYLDASVSSRTDSAVWTNTKAGYLDVAISSRATTAGIWDYLTASATTVGSIGKMLVDRIDDTITSRMAAGAVVVAPGSIQVSSYAAGQDPATLVWNTLTSALTGSGTVGKLVNDNLTTILSRTDVATSTRADGSAWTNAKAAYVDIAISSRSAISALDVWNVSTSSLTTAGSIGKRVTDNLDATISSRLATSGYTAPDNTTIGNIYARTDVATSTRLAPAGITSLAADVTTILGRVDVAVSTRADATYYTNTRAAKLDYLDAAISSIGTNVTVAGYAAGQSPATLVWAAATSGLTTAGSVGKLITDNIDATISSRTSPSDLTSLAADVTSIKSTVTTNLNATISSRAAAADWTPARAAYLDFIPQDTNDIQTIKTNVATILTRTDVATSTRASATDWTSVRAAKLDYLDTTLSTLATASALGLVATDVSAAKATIDTRLDTTISSRATTSGIWTALTSGMTTAGSIGKLITDYLDVAVSTRSTGGPVTIQTGSIEVASYAGGQDPASLVWSALTASLTTAGSIGALLAGRLPYLDVAVSSRLSGGVGSIPYQVTVVADDGTTPIAGASVWVTTDINGTNVVAGTLTTSAQGTATFLLDGGAYYLWRQAEGWQFQNPVAITVS